MRNYIKTVGALAAASTLVAGSASAELEGEVHVGYANMYEFRFYDVGDDLVEAGFDLAYDTGAVTFSGGLWYGSWEAPTAIAFPAGGPGFVTRAPSSELDIYAGIGGELGPVSLELGYIYYMFPSYSSLNTQEVYLSAGIEMFWGIGLNSTAFWDFDLYEGLYVDTSISKSFQFNECVSLDLALGFGYSDDHGLQVASAPSIGDVNGINGWYFSAQLPWEFRSGVTLTPYLKFTDGDSSMQTGSSIADIGEDYVIAGLKLGATF
ncbi:hypothetical protein [Haloferula sp.]|uniref:hypothetical protein n=1 Tax=Haloferula sp. TaxID=2497595 RepID=UPI00329BADEC